MLMSSIAKKTIKCTCTIDIYWIKPPLSFCLRNDKRQLSKMKFIMGWNGWKTEWLPLSLSKIMLLFIIHRKTGSLSSISASLFLPSEKPCRKRDCSLFRHSFWAELFLCFLSSFLRSSSGMIAASLKNADWRTVLIRPPSPISLPILIPSIV